MPLTPQITITGTTQDITGSVNVSSIVCELENYGSNVPRVSGTSILVQVKTTAVANGSGVFTLTIYGNDVITPSGTFYNIKYLNAAGAPVAVVPYQFTGSRTIDLSSQAPLITFPNAVLPQVDFSNLTGNIAVGQMNSGLLASSSTFWRGDGTWVAVSAPTSFTPISHQFLTGMNGSGVFSAAQPAFTDISGSVAAAQLPNPSATTLGGIQSFAAVSHQWINSISISGVPSATRPAAADLSDTAASGNVLRGNGTSFVSAALSAADLSNGTTGTAGTAVVLATSPTLITPNIGVATGTSLTTTGIIKSQVGGGGTSSGLQVSAGNAALLIQNTGATADNKIWDIATSGSQLLFRHIDDAQSIFGTYMTVTRSGGSNTSVQFGAGGGTQTLPTATDTLVGKATTDVFTNKTLDTAGTGNVFKINGTGITAVTGSGSVVLSASPTITGTLSAAAISASGTSTCSRCFQSVSNANVTPVTVTSTTSQTSLQTVTTLSAELNTVGRWITIRARGFHSSGATGGTITYKLAIGATNLITLGAFTLANNLPNNAWYMEFDIMVQTAGASGALEVHSNCVLNNVASSAFFNSATIPSIDVTGAVTFTLSSTATQTTTSTTSRMMGYQRNN